MRFLVTIFSILFATNGFSIDNPKLAVSTNTDIVLHQENSKNIQEISEKVDIINNGIDKYKTCIDKGLIYLGTGASNVDSDNCYDVTNTLNAETNYRPVLAGYLKFSSVVSKVAFYTSAIDYESTVTKRFSADRLCNSQYPGSRALVYDDLKYVLSTLSNPANISRNPVWVYDSVQSFYSQSTSQVMAKDSNVYYELSDCNGWYTTAPFHEGGALQIDNNGHGSFLKYKPLICSDGAYIACISN